MVNHRVSSGELNVLLIGPSRPRAMTSNYTHFWVTGYKMVCPMLLDHCLSCLSVMLVNYGKTVGWIKMKLGVALSLATLCYICGLIYPCPKGAHSPSPIFNFRPMSFVAKRPPISATAEL